MRKYILLVIAAMFLVACGDVKVHEDVNEEVAEDALQLMKVVTKNVDKDTLYEDASSNDKNVVDSYYKKYIGEFSTKKSLYDGVDEDILIVSNATAVRYMDGITLETEKEDLKDSNDTLKEFVESGQGYSHKEESDERELTERKGMSEDVIEDAIFLSDLIEELLDEGVLYEDLDESDSRYASIENFDYDEYKNDDEEYSLSEMIILGNVRTLVSDYQLRDILELSTDDLYDGVESVRESVEDTD